MILLETRCCSKWLSKGTQRYRIYLSWSSALWNRQVLNVFKSQLPRENIKGAPASILRVASESSHHFFKSNVPGFQSFQHRFVGRIVAASVFHQRKWNGKANSYWKLNFVAVKYTTVPVVLKNNFCCAQRTKSSPAAQILWRALLWQKSTYWSKKYLKTAVKKCKTNSEVSKSYR